ncbi:hypothetical protein SPRG_09741 [Saprolegnia parasitica CBS 223.65]|uniref:Uncharacterized protein n=1 Tax=Saprolegnia parasitica (strain CBS 223.65) TaxID=695850 RepID=A0A067CEM6_SAPPC|nr:hypothetical protein SPRG_09741 [Saprolegnia parasitica CBS 223.65]KDO25011.1 hypothetical protein SPRG_09741 [Saprolegnia parasitica CBS 223.65]|eukprot:XP_012204280.1 hypothetical protein SPRG_09741 [Saprolegnia parasitica CBS 223.65]
MSAQLLPLVTAYQVGVNQDVCILTRLGHDPPDGDLGPVHAVMAPWLDRVGFRFVPQLCPSLVFSYALEYGRVDLVRELMAAHMLCFTGQQWLLLYGAWRRCMGKHLHLQWQNTADGDGNIHGGYVSFYCSMCANGTCIFGSYLAYHVPGPPVLSPRGRGRPASTKSRRLPALRRHHQSSGLAACGVGSMRWVGIRIYSDAGSDGFV